MVVNFTQLKSIYNRQIDSMLASTGLATQVLFNFGTTKNNICPNCIYDVNLKKSSNKYKSGGPIPFVLGKICPYCSGVGFYGEIKTRTGYLVVLWDYKTWINPPTNISNPDGYIQTICDKTYLTDIRNCKDIVVFYHTNKSNPVFELEAEPNPVGLGDNNYLICTWKKVGVSDSIPSVTPTPTLTPTVSVSTSVTPTPTPTITGSLTPTPTPTPTIP